MRTRLMLVLVVVLSGAVVGTSVARANATYSDSIAGTEVAFTSTQGRFVGTASGDLPGAWQAVVDHTPLDPNATITGGTFTLATVLNGSGVTVLGTFAQGGTITRIKAGTGCRDQVYTVADTLTDVGVGGGTGTGAVTATLTHHRTRILGHCITYAATVVGTVNLTF
jgi:hypothetical protein